MPAIFARLVEIGKTVVHDAPRVLDLMPSVAKDEIINRQFLPDQFRAAQGMATPDLANLIRRLVTAESGLTWLGGSAATGIRLFRIPNERDLDLADRLGDEVLGYGYNAYLPLGWSARGVTTMAAYRRIPEIERARRLEHEIECQREHEEAERRRGLRRRKGEERVRDQKNASAQCRLLLERLNCFNMVTRFGYIISDESQFPRLFPEEYPRLAIAHASELPRLFGRTS